MKKLIFVFALLCGLTVTVNAQTAPKKESTTKHATCGDKGHTCSADCKKDVKTDKKATTTLKEHTCNASCTANKHVTTCGEKGHTCTAECKKTM